MKLTCIDCERLIRCTASRGADHQTHFCGDWEPTHPSVIDARLDALKRFGSAATRGFTKERKQTHMDIQSINKCVAEGNIDELNKLRTASIQPTILMLVASRLTGDSQTIAAKLRELNSDNDARVNYLVDILVDYAQQSSEAASIEAAKAAEKVEESAHAEKPPKTTQRRASRKRQATTVDADAEAIEIAKAKEAEAEAEAKEAIEKDVDAVVKALTPTNQGVADRLLDEQTRTRQSIEKIAGCIFGYNAMLNDLTKHVGALERRIEEVAEIASSITDLSKEVEGISYCTTRIENNLRRIKGAFEGFEIELIGSGTLGDTPFANATQDWE